MLAQLAVQKAVRTRSSKNLGTVDVYTASTGALERVGRGLADKRANLGIYIYLCNTIHRGRNIRAVVCVG